MDFTSIYLPKARAFFYQKPTHINTYSRPILTNPIPTNHTITITWTPPQPGCVKLNIDDTNPVPTNRTIIIKWTPPQPGWVKLNTDGACKGNPGQSGAGALLRNDKGEWISGCHRFIGVTTSTIAELWGLRDGLQLAINLGIKKLEIEVDSTVIISLLKSNDPSASLFSSLVDDCRSLLLNFQESSIQHCYREANFCADFLANLGCQQNSDNMLQVLQSIPNGLDLLLDFDSRGEGRQRIIRN